MIGATDSARCRSRPISPRRRRRRPKEVRSPAASLMIGMRHTHSAIFQAVRMGPPFYALDGARERGNDRARTRSSRDASLFREMGGLKRIARLPATHHRAVQHRPLTFFPLLSPRRRRVQERGPAGFAQGTPPDVDRRSDAVSDPIARIVSGNSIQPEETPSSSRAEQLRTFFALARGRLARRGGIAIHAEVLHLPHASRDMDKKDKNADVYSALPSPLTGPRSAWGSSGASRGRPRRLLWPARSTRTSRSGRMARLGPCSAGGCRRPPFPPAPAKKSAPGQKLTKLTLDHVFFHACDRVG